jgi:hypothetical protein
MKVKLSLMPYFRAGPTSMGASERRVSINMKVARQ